MVKRIYMVRHGQGEHNVRMDPNIPDPLLTELGRDQARALCEKTETIQKTAQLLLTSPLRRCLETTVLAFPTLVDRLIYDEAGNKAVVLDTIQGAALSETQVVNQALKNRAIVLDILQESGADPSSTPTSPVEVLKHSQDGIYQHLNYDLLSADYASKMGIFAPSARKVRERAKMVRKFLREREEDEIVVVSHGGIMHSIVDRGDQETEWDNCQVRIFTFDNSDPNASDPDMIELEDEQAISLTTRAGGAASASALRVDQLPGAIGVTPDE